MGLVERISGERLDQREHLLGKLRRKTLTIGAGQEFLPLLSHDLRDLLAHRLADYVRFTERVSGERLRDVEHLILIDDHAVGLFENVLQVRVQVGHRHPAVLGVYEGRYMLHRAGAIERDHRGDVAQRRGLELLDVAGHTAAF